MIHIFVNENYNREALKNLLVFINSNIDKKLTYGVNSNYDKDVVIEMDDPINEESVRNLSGMSTFEDDLCILVEELYCKAFVNGEAAIIRNYVEDME